MRLVICPRTSVAKYLDAPVTHFVSLLDPDEVGKPMEIPRMVHAKLILVFSDLDDYEIKIPKFAKYDPPTAEHVQQLIDFGRQMAQEDDFGLLMHCEAGISRSTASAITILTAAGYSPQMAFGIVRRVCPEMLPNRRIMRITDEILGTGGRLHHMAVIHRQKAFQRAGYEDPTAVLYREAMEAAAKPKTLWERLLVWLPARWRPKSGHACAVKPTEQRGATPASTAIR